MPRIAPHCFILTLAALALGGRALTLAAIDETIPPQTPPAHVPSAPPPEAPIPRQPTLRPAVAEPAPLSPTIDRGLAWLVAHQLENGAWGQGDEAESMGEGMRGIAATPSLGDTCIAALALFRADGSPSGRHAEALEKALQFVVGEIESSDDSTLQVASIRGSRIQAKIGPFVDTFLASLLLSEIKGRAPTAMSPRMEAALAKVLRKIERNQRQDGTWSQEGWAPALSESIATKGLNRAAQSGAAVELDAIARAEARVRGQLAQGEPLGTGAGDAGIALYGGAFRIAVLQDTVNSDATREKELRDQAANAPSPETRADAQRELGRLATTAAACDSLRESIVDRLDDDSFLAGFGSNGGEEFLSYMNIGESLVVAGGKTWTKWNGGMSGNLARIQNQDGSWTGHHCITGRTFCTATALLVLMTDRSPVPVKDDC